MSKYDVSIIRVPNSDPEPTHWQKFCVFLNECYYCTAEALIFSCGSEYGLNGGRISKLFVSHTSPWGTCGHVEIGYDRGNWVKRPDNAIGKAILNYFIQNPPEFVDFPEAHQPETSTED